MRSTVLVLIAVAALACSSDESQPAETAQGSSEQRATTGGEADMTGAMAANCPMQVQGTTVQVEEVDGGAALLFVTTGDVEALRERVRNMAAHHESYPTFGKSQQMGMSETLRPGSADDPSAGAKIGDADDAVSAGGRPEEPSAIEVDTRVEDIENGARLVLTPSNASDVESLRLQAEQEAQSMTAGECPMMPHSIPSEY